MYEEEIALINGRLPSKEELIIRKLGDIIESNVTESKIFAEKFRPNPNQKLMTEMIEASQVPPDKWIHFLCYGPTGCLSADTQIPFVVRDSKGKLINKKGGSIERLYERFHRIAVKGLGKSRIVPQGAEFFLASANEETHAIGLNQIVDVIDNGVREVYTLTTETGRQIQATKNHPFLTKEGYVNLEDLSPGDKVLVHVNYIPKVGRKKRPLRNYVFVKWHPVAGVKRVGKYVYHRIAKARAVVEADMNGMKFEEYLRVLNEGPCPNLLFLSRSTEVHHKDEDCRNDSLENLEALDIDTHHEVHNVKERIVRYAIEEKIVSIEYYDLQQVYDITMKGPNHNFVANGFVVHNSGKSYGVYAYVIDKMLKHPGTMVLGVRRTVTDIKESIYKDFLKIINKFGIPHTKNDTDTAIFFPNGSTIRCRSDKALVDANSDKSHALGSTAYHFVIYEEADSCSQELIATMAGRMRAPGNFRKVLFYLCNPPSKRHWLWKMFHDSNDPHDPKSRRRVLYCGVEDNVQHVGTGYIEAMREDFGIANPNLLKRLGFGLPGADTKGIPYYADDFNRDVHVSKSSLVWDPGYPMMRGWDFGISNAIVVLQWNPELNQWRFYEAHLGQEILFDPFCDRFLPEIIGTYPGAIWEDYCDKAGMAKDGKTGKTYFDLMRERGLRPRYPKKRGLAWSLNRISTMLRTSYKGRPKIIIDPKAEILIEAFEGGYVNMKNATDDDIRPLKDGVFDHIMDAARYPTMCIPMELHEGVNTGRVGYVQHESGLFTQDLSKSRVESRQIHSIRGAVSAPSRNPFGSRR